MQDSETNNWAVGISAAVQAGRWNEIPLARRLRIYRNLAWAAADFVKYMRDAYKIAVPFKRIQGWEARAGKPGFCAHGDSGIARTDPGVQFDWNLFFTYAQEELKKMDGVKPTTPPKETNTMSWTYPQFQVNPKAKPTLSKLKGWYLKDTDMKTNRNFAHEGEGYYVGELFIQGEHLGVGKELEVQFFLVDGAKRSGYYTQAIHGTEDGTFKGSVAFNQMIGPGTRVEALVTSNDEATKLVVWGFKSLRVKK